MAEGLDGALRGVLHDVFEDIALVGEVPVEHRVPCAEAFRDVCDRCLVIAAFRELGEGGLDHLFLDELATSSALPIRHPDRRFRGVLHAAEDSPQRLSEATRVV